MRKSLAEVYGQYNGRLIRIVLLIMAILQLAACTGPKALSTARHRHHDPLLLDFSASTDEVVASLASEFSRYHTSGMPSGPLPPEQIALAAIDRLEEGRIRDACLLMSAASYRYHQAGERAFRSGKGAHGDPGEEGKSLASPELLPGGAAAEWRLEERAAYQVCDFDEALKICRGLLDGSAQAERIVRLTLELTGREKRKGLETLKKRLSGALERENDKQSVGHALHDEKLAEAYLNSLAADSQESASSFTAFKYLAATPVSTFPLRGLELAIDPFEVHFFNLPRRSLMALHDELIGLLSHPKAATRSNALILLGRIASLHDFALLSHAAKTESDPEVKLSLSFALLKLGDKTQLPILFEAATTRRGAPAKDKDVDSRSARIRTHALTLINRLPPALLRELDPKKLTDLFIFSEADLLARVLILAILEKMAAGQTLPARTLGLLFEMTEFDEDMIREGAGRTLAAVSQLDPPTIILLLNRYRSEPKRRALLHRLARIVRPADLEWLSAHYRDHQGIAERMAVVGAVGRVSDKAAEDMLFDWLIHTDSPRLHAHIALVLAGRPGLDKNRLGEHLAGRGGPASLDILIGIDHAESRRLLDDFLASENYEFRSLAARLIGNRGMQDYMPALKSLVSYQSQEDYPHDVGVRRAALSSIMKLTMEKWLEAQISDKH